MRKVLNFVVFTVTLSTLILSTILLYHHLDKMSRSNQRDIKRREFAEIVYNQIEEFIRENSKIPTSVTIRGAKLQIDDKYTDVSIDERFLRPTNSQSESSSAIATVYCFISDGIEYGFGLKYESGKWVNFGTRECSQK